MAHHGEKCAAPKMTRAPHELGDIARAYASAVLAEQALSQQQRRVLRDVQRCRTAALGGHLDHCERSGFDRPAYNSCRNRHCPKCQRLAAAKWLEQRRERVLPVHHFHVVFTLPAELRALVAFNRRALFGVLFRAASRALLELGRDPKWLGAELGVTAVLHTWTRDLTFHPHLHCVVTGGGLRPDGTWVSTRPRFLFPVRVLGALFRGKTLDAVRRLARAGKLVFPDEAAPRDTEELERLLRKLYAKRWVVYAKPPFNDADGVFAYLGRYTHRVAISNHRIRDVDADGVVTFATRHGKTTRLPAVVFVRRFLRHVLPPHFVRIRHFGLLAPLNVHTRLVLARMLLGEPAPEAASSPTPANDGDEDMPDYVLRVLRLTGRDLRECPRCHARFVQRPLPRTRSRGPP